MVVSAAGVWARKEVLEKSKAKNKSFGSIRRLRFKSAAWRQRTGFLCDAHIMVVNVEPEKRP